MTVRPAKTQISLGIRPVWAVFAVRMKKPFILGYPLSASEDSDQTGWLPRLFWVFAGRTGHLVGFVVRWLINVKNNVRFNHGFEVFNVYCDPRININARRGGGEGGGAGALISTEGRNKHLTPKTRGWMLLLHTPNLFLVHLYLVFNNYSNNLSRPYVEMTLSYQPLK